MTEIEGLKAENERLRSLVREAYRAGFWHFCGPANHQECDNAERDEQAGWVEWQSENAVP